MPAISRFGPLRRRWNIRPFQTKYRISIVNSFSPLRVGVGISFPLPFQILLWHVDQLEALRHVNRIATSVKLPGSTPFVILGTFKGTRSGKIYAKRGQSD